MLTTSDGFKIATQLDAKVTEGRNHTKVVVEIDGVVIGRYGLSRASKERNANFIAKQIGGIRQWQARQLSLCTLSKEEYVAIIRKESPDLFKMK